MVKVSWPAGEAAPSKAQLLDIFAPFGTLVNAGVNEGKHSALVLFSSVGAAQNAEAHFAAGVRRAPAAAGWTVQRQVPDGGDSAERPSTSTLALSNELALSPASTLALSPSSSTVLALSPSSGRSAASVARSGSLVARTLHVSWAAADRPARVRDVDAALGERGTILKCGFASRKNMALVQFATKEEAVAAQAHYVGRWRVRQYAALLYGQSADASSDAFDLSREPARDRALLLAWDPALTEASEDVDALVVALAVPVVALAQRQHTAVVLCRTAADARAAADEVETSYAALFRASWLGGAASLSAPVPQKIRDDAQPLEAPKPLDAARPAESQPPLVPPLDTARPTEAAPPVEAAPPSAVPDPAAALSQRRIEARLPTDTSCFLQPEPVDSRVHAVAANAGVGEVSLPSTQPAIPAAALHAPNAQSPRAPRASDGHQSRAPLAPAESWTVYQRPAARSAAPVPGLFAAPAGRWHDEAIPPAARSPPRPDDDSSLAAMTDTPHPEGQARPQSVRHDARAAGEPSADEDDWRGRALRAEQSVAERQSRAPGAAGGGTNEWRRRALQAESELGRPFDDGRPFSAADAALSAREMAHILQSHAQTLGGEIRATIKDVVIASAAATQSMGLAYEGGGAWRGDWGARGDYTAQGPPRVAPLPRPEADGYAADYAAASPVFSPPRARRRPGDVATPGRGDAFSQLLDEQARVARQLEGDLGRLRAELADIRGDDRRPGRAERAPAARAWQQPFTWHGDVTPYGKAPPGDFGFAPASMQPPYVRTQHMATTLSAHGHYKPSPDGFRPQDPALRQWWGTVQAPGAQYGAESSQGRYY